MVRQQVRPVDPLQDLGGGQGGLPLTCLPGGKITSDTLLLARAASRIPFRVCIDLGTGTGGVLRNLLSGDGLRIGVDISFEALAGFPSDAGSPVLCPVEMIPSVFRKGCADLVTANPPYFHRGSGRTPPGEYRRLSRMGDPLLQARFVFSGAFLLRPGGTMLLSCREERILESETCLRAAGFSRIGRLSDGG
ncbi:MAG TPA: hypothetical protein P5207_08605, partial [Candidatus Sabulitectum sp.]|nr:hypothetical protein [Candidatus Sabulitectum sp.]